MNTSPLRVAVVGGGIGGAATAHALLRRGMDVRLYEQAAALAEVGAGVAIQPNGVRMLRRLGLGDELIRLGARWIDPQFRRADGSYAAAMWPPESASQIEFYGMHRADLLAMFVDRLPADIVKAGHRCIGVEQDDRQAVITFANGARTTADVVIAADGIHSTLQRFVVAPSAPLYSGSVAYRGVISAASVSWPPGAMRNWLGAGRHFLVFPVRAGLLINYVGFVTTDEPMKESWSARGDPSALAREFAGWDPTVETIIAQVKTTFRWVVRSRAACNLDSRSPDPTGRRRPPDAAARRTRSQSGDRRRRCVGDRAEPRRPQVSPPGAADLRAAEARADCRRPAHVAREWCSL